ncbi:MULTISPECIES: DUF4429 domain-containing protein [unclassified Nocardiopsis]|uniref:DUF4429 domain-containing protein n=1 Tax=unclassified Nocardiopsis TaxID=2649073 RepID=UPI00135B4CA3|nr:MULTISPECIES: DUF4429 domain-containing protein [unclassified Nocardiopsis]
MDDVRGDQATWRFDGETVAITYHTRGWFKDPLLKRIGRLELPVGAVAEVDFRPGGGRGRGWLLQLRLRERTDPYAAVGAMLREGPQPFRLTGPAATELVTEYLADQIRFAAERHTDPPPADTATRLVPPPPFHIRTAEGTATVDRSRVLLVWSGAAANGRKRKVQRREYPLDRVTGAEWTPADDWEWGYLRVVTDTSAKEGPAKPANDLHVLRADEGAESYDALLMAAAVTARVWAADEGPAQGSPASRVLRALRAGAEKPSGGAERVRDTDWIFRQIKRLGELHDEGLLTDEEFTAKKAELLDRI